jgi:hypothetical protein
VHAERLRELCKRCDRGIFFGALDAAYIAQRQVVARAPSRRYCPSIFSYRPATNYTRRMWDGQRVAEWREFVLCRWRMMAPRWRAFQSTLGHYYLQLETAEQNSDWRKRPSNIGSVALHSLILIALIVWAHPWAKAGGPSKVVSVYVVMQRPSINDAAPSSSARPTPRSPQMDAGPTATAQNNPATETLSARQTPSALSAAAQQSALPEPKPRGETADKPIKAVMPTESSSVPNAPADARSSGAPVAAGSQAVALQNALRGQMIACWNPPFMPGRAALVSVDFDLVLKPDGTLARSPELTPEMAAEAVHSPTLRAAVEAALQALKFCAPFRLPRETYDQWREINPFHFDPSEFMPH